jgi:transposase-like protein
MKTCALCTRQTTPKNGVTNTSDAVLCHLCCAQYEASPEYRRERYFEKRNKPAARLALVDYVTNVLKIRQAHDEAEKRTSTEAKA